MEWLKDREKETFMENVVKRVTIKDQKQRA